MRSRGHVAWRCRSCSRLDPEAAQEVFANKDNVFSQKGQEFFLGRFFKRWTDVPGLRGTPFPSSDHAGSVHARAPERLPGFDGHDRPRSRGGAIRATNCWFTPTSNAHFSTLRPSCSWATNPARKADLMARPSPTVCAPPRLWFGFRFLDLRWSAGVRGRRVLEQYFHTTLTRDGLWRRRSLRSTVPRPRRGRQSVHRRRRRQPHDLSHDGRDRYLRGRRDGSLVSVGAPPGVAGPGARRVIG